MPKISSLPVVKSKQGILNKIYIQRFFDSGVSVDDNSYQLGTTLIFSLIPHQTIIFEITGRVGNNTAGTATMVKFKILDSDDEILDDQELYIDCPSTNTSSIAYKNLYTYEDFFEGATNDLTTIKILAYLNTTTATTTEASINAIFSTSIMNDITLINQIS